MRSIAALLLIATAAAAHNPPTDAPDVEKTASISTPCDDDLGCVFPVRKTDRGYEITVSGKLRGYDRASMPSSVWLTFMDQSGKVIFFGIAPVGGGTFTARCESRPEYQGAGFVRLNLRATRPACEEFLFEGILSVQR
ncbi:MAG TPA: hypothetical protein VL371_21325 [Gemmataceae bacterium]|jgi:hypothetical protein|nr:hypothetical protein [Gemmataceae bacterium]